MVTMQYVSQVTKIHYSIACNWRKGTDASIMDLELLLTLNLWTLIIDISFILIAQLFGRRLEAWSLDEQYATVKLTTCWDTMDAEEVEASTSASEVSHCREPRTIRGYPCKHALSQTLVLLALICLGVVLSVCLYFLSVCSENESSWTKGKGGKKPISFPCHSFNFCCCCCSSCCCCCSYQNFFKYLVSFGVTVNHSICAKPLSKLVSKHGA